MKFILDLHDDGYLLTKAHLKEACECARTKVEACERARKKVDYNDHHWGWTQFVLLWNGDYGKEWQQSFRETLERWYNVDDTFWDAFKIGTCTATKHFDDHFYASKQKSFPYPKTWPTMFARYKSDFMKRNKMTWKKFFQQQARLIKKLVDAKYEEVKLQSGGAKQPNAASKKGKPRPAQSRPRPCMNKTKRNLPRSSLTRVEKVTQANVDTKRRKLARHRAPTAIDQPIGLKASILKRASEAVAQTQSSQTVERWQFSQTWQFSQLEIKVAHILANMDRAVHPEQLLQYQSREQLGHPPTTPVLYDAAASPNMSTMAQQQQWHGASKPMVMDLSTTWDPSGRNIGRRVEIGPDFFPCVSNPMRDSEPIFGSIAPMLTPESIAVAKPGFNNRPRRLPSGWQCSTVR